MSLQKRILKCIKPAFPKAIKTSLWLLKITIPVTFAVMVLSYTGYLEVFSAYLQPFFSYFGLPAETSFVLITSSLTNVYSALAIISTLGIPAREATILALMCLISHGFIIESAIVRKTGSNVMRMLTVRLVFSIIAGLFLGLVLPEQATVAAKQVVLAKASFGEVFIHWGKGMLFLAVKIVLLVTGLFILQNILEEFGVIKWLSKVMQPIMTVLGLPKSTATSLIVVNTVGLAYGSAIVIDQHEKGYISKQDADLLNHHAVISHSQLEDPLLFAALGLTIHWLVWPRILLAIVAVWLRRLELHWRNKSLKE